MKAKAIIHINQHKIRSNKKTGAREPVITVKKRRANTYAKRVDILDKDGNVIASIRYEPDKPLKCGAVCWVESTNDLEIS